MSQSPGAFVLGHRQLFILPSRYGIIFCLVLFVLLLTAINYENGLVYGLVFLLASMANISLIYTHRNLYRLEITAHNAAPCFVGDTAHFPIAIHNPTGLLRYGITLELPRKRRIGGASFGRINMDGKDNQYINLEIDTYRRGYLSLPVFMLSTQYPLGLAYSWSRKITLSAHCLVYPQPVGNRPLPFAAGSSKSDSVGSRRDGDDFDALRQYRAGDSPRHIAWKALARGRGLLTKQFTGGENEEVWLRWSDLPGLDPESRLSQLCRWVLDAENAQLRYGLILPEKTFAPACGQTHHHACLKALALHGKDEA